MKAVLDVGQFVSATINGRGHPAQILAHWRRGTFELVTSPPILSDLRRVLAYPRIRRRHQWTDDEISLFVDAVFLAATVTPGHISGVDVVKNDPTDNKILACAKEAAVDYIVASDEHLTILGSFEGIPIIPPHQFLLILEGERT